MTDEQRRAVLIAQWHAEGICTEDEPAHDCPCDRPKGGELEIRKVWDAHYAKKDCERNTLPPAEDKARAYLSEMQGVDVLDNGIPIGIWTQARDACDPACPGWALFNEGTDREGIQRCDACDRFADDDAALAHVVALARATEVAMAPRTCPPPPWTCEACGGSNVQITAWIDPNAASGSVIVDDEGPLDPRLAGGAWCADCDANTPMVAPT